MSSKEVPVSNAAAAADALAAPPTETHSPSAAPEPPPPAEPSAQPTAPGPPPRLADGIELIGEFADSGFKRAPFIARRSDGQVVQMPELLYRLAEQIDGHTGWSELADRFSRATRRGVTEANVRMLVEQRLRPLGVVAPADDDDTVALRHVDPLLALKFRAALVPDGPVRRLTTIFKPLFAPPVMVAAILVFLGLDGWLFFVHGISQSLRHTLDDPVLMLLMIAGIIVATAFHEIGHATACRYGGARPGVMGVGIYIVWPAFYTDITDAYRLGKWGRLRADVGGMYFNALFALVVAGLYAVTSFEPLLLLVVLQNFAILEQALPLLRLDGYYILSDLTGVPDIFVRIRPILTSLLPRRPSDPRVTELKSWVRGVVSVYVLAIVVFLTLTGLGIVINLPRLLATGYSSAADHFSAVGPAFDHGRVAQGVLDVVQGLFLILPTIGLVYTVVRVAHRAIARALRWSAGHPARRATLAVAGSAAVAVAALSWWPNGEYRPIQPGERGTIGGLFGQVAHLPSGRPSLTVERARQLGLSPGGSAGRGRGARAGGSGSGAAGTGGTLGARIRIHNHHAGSSSSSGSATNTTTGTATLSQSSTAPGQTPAPATSTSQSSSTTSTTSGAPPSSTTTTASTSTTATSTSASQPAAAPADTSTTTTTSSTP